MSTEPTLSQPPKPALDAPVLIPAKRSWKWPSYKSGPVEHWLGEALTQFINGFIAGWKHGVGTGAGTGILTGTTEVAANMTAWQQILISGGATLFAMVMNGSNQVSSWHEKNPFPNPWGTGNTNPPFPTQ